jgi:hypothetical protein
LPHLFHFGARKIPHKINPKMKHEPLSNERPIKQAAGKGNGRKRKIEGEEYEREIRR